MTNYTQLKTTVDRRTAKTGRAIFGVINGVLKSFDIKLSIEDVLTVVNVLIRAAKLSKFRKMAMVFQFGTLT